MNRRTAVVAAISVCMTASALLAVQRGPGGPGGRGGRGPIPAYYTGRSVPLGPVDTTAADRACQGQGHARLVCLANLLKQGTSPALLERLQLPYSAADAKRWSNFPPGVFPNRVGVTVGEFEPAQVGVVKALLKAAAGVAANEGYDEIEQNTNADDLLKSISGPGQFGSGNFQIALIGTPAPMGTWTLYFGGHHLAFGTTYKDGVLIGATPSFRGIEPFTSYNVNGRDNAPMAQERAAFAAMLTSLTAAEQAKAKLAQTFTDIIVGPQRDDSFLAAPEGVRVGDLTQDKRNLVLRAIETYVGDIATADAQAILTKYRSELAETHIAFSGTPNMDTVNDYVRIDGPSVWIEYSMQAGIVMPGPHPHSVWRDRKTDYGGNK